MFSSGKIVKTFLSKSGKKIVIRYPKWEDLEQFTSYINNLSAEDTFVTFSGEKISKKEEAETLSRWFCEMELNNKIVLGCFYDERLIAIANIDRNLTNRKRSLHTGIFGISVAKEFRGDGIGYQLGKTIIEEAKKELKGIKIIILDVFGINKIAQNLYKKLGFKEVGRIPKAILYREKYVDEVTMVLPF